MLAGARAGDFFNRLGPYMESKSSIELLPDSVRLSDWRGTSEYVPTNTPAYRTAYTS